MAVSSSMDSPVNPSKRIAIVGLGYVGLPLAIQFARSNASVLGLDIDEAKVSAVNNGQSYIKHIAPKTIAEVLKVGRLSASSDFSKIAELDAVIICVPTPLNKNREPDISYITDTGRRIAPHLKRGMLIVLESTTYPGTTDEDLREVLEAGSGLKAGEDFHLAFSPEREDPGNPHSVVATIPKIVGGLTPACLKKAVELYSLAIKQLVPVKSMKTAEATKLLENIFRSVNIALVNELKVVYDAMGIDIWVVIEAAKPKPFGFMPFYPGPGLGGHCIPIDPFYLTWKAREFDISTRFIELAGEINAAMPQYVVDKLARSLDQRAGRGLRGAKILMIGIAYKKNVEDIRESPAFKLIELLEERGAAVDFHDPYVQTIPSTRKHAKLAGRASIAWDPKSIGNYDAVLIATDHDNIDYRALVEHASLVIDTRNACARAGMTSPNIVKS